MITTSADFNHDGEATVSAELNADVPSQAAAIDALAKSLADGKSEVKVSSDHSGHIRIAVSVKGEQPVLPVAEGAEQVEPEDAEKAAPQSKGRKSKKDDQ